MKKTPKQRDLVYDVGLNRGQDTDFYLPKAFRVIAFEAVPENIEFCKERFAEELADRRLIIVEGAMTDSPEAEVKFFRDYSCMIHTKKGNKSIYHLKRTSNRPVSGWYDTHAKHPSSLLSLIYTLVSFPVFLGCH